MITAPPARAPRTRAPMSEPLATVVVPRGWGGLADAAGFFPEDLPADWRLTYFANAFGAVLVPWPDWREADATTLAGWRDEVHGGFRFLLEAPLAAPGTAQALAGAAAALGPALGMAVDVAAAGHAETPRRCLRPGTWGDDALAQTTDYAMAPPAAVYADPRGARRWLDELARRFGAAPRAVLLTRPRSAELAAWSELIRLLGLDRPAA